MKHRFSSTDASAVVANLRHSLLEKRVANIYDINNKTYIIKLATTGSPEKHFIMIESGIRVHSTKYSRDKAQIPSVFTLKVIFFTSSQFEQLELTFQYV